MRFRLALFCGAFALAALPAFAASETPEAFMKRFSDTYLPAPPDAPAPSTEADDFCGDFCEPDLKAIVAHANDHDYVMEYDPFCSCQDVVDGLPVEAVKATGPDTAEATLHRDETIWVIVLKQHDGAWKIADVIEKAPYDNGSWKARISELMAAAAK
ncbi:hypothetical protein sos41_00320 [Alphaproteobacteria bacterium SO-S41]|nr:hypothetical protein sos41_00320 [Alphaproteobacteria bacterium SO-S41]